MITPCSNNTVLNYLSRINCLLDRWDQRVLVTLACSLQGDQYLAEEVALSDLDTWYCNRYC